MKKALVIIVLSFPFLVQGQITIMEIPQDTNAKTEHIIVYDSLTNIRTRKNNNQFSYSHLIGQTIMSCEKHYMGKYYTIDSMKPKNLNKQKHSSLIHAEFLQRAKYKGYSKNEVALISE